MLPQSPKADLQPARSRSCAAASSELGFIGCNLNPDPGGGHFTHPPLTDEFWFPIYEKMCELDVPAMIHVSGSCNPAMHATGAFYIAADTIAFMQLLAGRPVRRFPDLALHHPARRRRGALSLGPLPRASPTCSSSRASTST